jgi:small subunit ribosomal protein S4
MSTLPPRGDEALSQGRPLLQKCAVERRNYPPGQHGQGRTRISDYGLQLREKQKVKRIYGVLERKMVRTMKQASRMKGLSGENLLSLLERRLDSVVFRLGFATSRVEARQLVRHGHFLVNGRRATIPSMLVKPGWRIALTEKARKVERITACPAGSSSTRRSSRAPSAGCPCVTRSRCRSRNSSS